MSSPLYSVIDIISRGCASGFRPHMTAMDWKERLAAIGSDPRLRYAMFLLGVVCMVLAPIIGVLPGPGGLVLFAVGAGLALKNSHWAKKRYVVLKKRWPKYGNWVDRGLRRPSARRRAAIQRAEKAKDD